ncbi:MAG: hypothetical protein II775_06905, partial [Prevotella sp.]|nr:hypothetical protein [Prevotella sp.]
MWALTYQFAQPYTGDIHVELLSGEEWLSTAQQLSVSVTGPAGDAPETPVPAQEEGTEGEEPAQEEAASVPPTQALATLTVTSTPAPADSQGLSAMTQSLAASAAAEEEQAEDAADGAEDAAEEAEADSEAEDASADAGSAPEEAAGEEAVS